jgi:hypothetical protein
VNVYVKNRKKTYAAYQFGATPKDIKFSDGFTMTAKPGMTVKTSEE